MLSFVDPCSYERKIVTEELSKKKHSLLANSLFFLDFNRQLTQSSIKCSRNATTFSNHESLIVLLNFTHTI